MMPLRKAKQPNLEAERGCLGPCCAYRITWQDPHLAAIVSVATNAQREPDCNRARLARYKVLSHATVEVVTGT